jgi:hypothetical protein
VFHRTRSGLDSAHVYVRTSDAIVTALTQDNKTLEGWKAESVVMCVYFLALLFVHFDDGYSVRLRQAQLAG